MKNFFLGIIFIFLIAMISHLLFSHFGFNPTDNGFILAGSRRILDGQVPHRDFISIRTPGSHFLHVPFILFGGDYTFWISRYLAWIQFASIAWIWTIVISRLLNLSFSIIEKFAATLIIFTFSVHHFPIMVWHTLDALFFISLGIILCFIQHKFSKMLGYILMGIAPLCKQNFFIMIPIILIFFNDWRQKRFWFMAAVPAIIYTIYLTINGAVPDAILQLSSHTDFISAGLKICISHLTTLLGVSTGYLAISLLSRQQRLLGSFVVLAAFLSSALFLATGRYVMDTSFGIFGVAVGIIIYLIIKERKLTKHIKCGLLIISIAWCVSISIGYATPALMTGPLIIFLTVCWKKKMENIPLILLATISLTAFGIARTNFIYREQPAAYLNKDLGSVFPGAKFIKVSDRTYGFFADLEGAKKIARNKGKIYCIIPDAPCNWVKDPQSNPLSVDWPQNLELAKKELLDRVIGDLEMHRGEIIIIVQKYEAHTLAFSSIPVANSYPIINYVRTNFRKNGETVFFDLYE